MPLQVNSEFKTLTQFLKTVLSQKASDGRELSSLILDVARACKTIAIHSKYGVLGGVTGDHPAENGKSINVQGETQKKLDVLSNDIFIHCTESGGYLAGMVSEELELPYQIPAPYARGPLLLLFDPLDGSNNIDINSPVGSIFSILRRQNVSNEESIQTDVLEQDFLQIGNVQIAAGYAIYGPSTMLILALDHTINGFTLDPQMGEFLLTHPAMQVPATTNEFAINASNSRFWEEPIERYVDECLAGKSGARGKDFNMRWIGSLVAEAHRILMRGGVFIYPRDNKTPLSSGRLRLLYETNPIGLIMEWAGGRASTGEKPMLEVSPDNMHQRIGFVFGSSAEVERIEKYHAQGSSEYRADGNMWEQSVNSTQVSKD